MGSITGLVEATITRLALKSFWFCSKIILALFQNHSGFVSKPLSFPQSPSGFAPKSIWSGSKSILVLLQNHSGIAPKLFWPRPKIILVSFKNHSGFAPKSFWFCHFKFCTVPLSHWAHRARNHFLYRTRVP